MPDSANYEKILEKISEVREDVAVLKNETQHLKGDLSDVKRELSNIKEQDIHQNKLLDEHIAGVATAQRRLDMEIEARKSEKSLIDHQILEIDARLKRAESLPKTIHGLEKFIKWFSGVALTLIALAEYLRHS